MKVLFLTSEVAPWSKTGGLGDVAGALPRALAERGLEVRVMSPLYASVPRDGLSPDGPLLTVRFPAFTRDARFHSTSPAPGLTCTFIEEPGYFGRAGEYGEGSVVYPDNARRFAFFTMAALTGAHQRGFLPDIVHSNDWQTGLAALALASGYRRSPLGQARSVFTVHNLAYQGNFPRAELDALGIPASRFTVTGVEFYQQLSFMKAGLQLSDALTTVSPSYAKEIQAKEGGMGFDGLLRQRAGALHGILNGVDVREWNPATDVLLPARFSAADLSGRDVCRRALLGGLGLEAPKPGMPLFGLVGRMVEQKGVDLVQAVLPHFLEHGASAVVIGTGEARFENAWLALQQRFPTRLGVKVGFDNGTAHLIEAAADFFLMPSRFEPCGLNQMYSSLYGAVPIVRAVGGLADTVLDEREAHGTGIVFKDATAEGLRGALARAVELLGAPERLARVRKAGMVKDFSWGVAAGRYDELYQSLLLQPRQAVR